MDNVIIQYVGFQTELSTIAFCALWTPIALGFKLRGISVIDLYQFPQETQIKFMSRNLWEPEQYLQVFPSGLADVAAFGSVEVVQFGGYTNNEKGTRSLQVAEKLSVLFTQTKTGGSESASVFDRVTSLVPYRFALESIGNDSTVVAALGEVRLSGTHVCRL
jgi:hypothetical protein